MINITEHILLFRKFLMDSWGNLGPLLENHDWDSEPYIVDDWQRVNWEILVERELLINEGHINSYLSPYRRIRITDQDAPITHLVLCQPKEGSVLFDYRKNKAIPTDRLLVFYYFCNIFDHPRWKVAPRFEAMEFVLGILDEGNEDGLFVADIDKAEFFLCPIDDTGPENLEKWYWR